MKKTPATEPGSGVKASTEDRHSPTPLGQNRQLSKIGALRDLLIGLLHEHERDGALPTSARFLFYELVQRGQLSKQSTGARRPDQDLHDALTDVREDRRVPWHWIVDETRSLEDYTGYTSIKDGVLSKLPYIKIDPWRDLAPIILTESRSLAGVLRDIVRGYCCCIASTNGQCGGFLRTNIAPMLTPGAVVLYFGDLDLSGGQIEDNTRRVLEQVIGGLLHWERVALTEEQVSDYNLPFITKRDRRYKDGRPHEAVETEALRQTVLMDILRARLDDLIPEPLTRVQERERRQRRRIAAILRGVR